VTGLSFACGQSVELLVEKFGKLVGEQGYADMGYRTPPDVVAVEWGLPLPLLVIVTERAADRVVSYATLLAKLIQEGNVYICIRYM
jgi:hypothetical protein